MKAYVSNVVFCVASLCLSLVGCSVEITRGYGFDKASIYCIAISQSIPIDLSMEQGSLMRSFLVGPVSHEGFS